MIARGAIGHARYYGFRAFINLVLLVLALLGSGQPARAELPIEEIGRVGSSSSLRPGKITFLWP